MQESDKTQVTQFLESFSFEYKNWLKNIDFDNLTKAKEIILACIKRGNRVHVTGIGKPDYVAGYISSLFSSTGVPTYKLHGTEAVHGSAGQVLPNDVVIAISNSGETEELKKTVTQLIKNKAHIIAVTGNSNSWLSKYSEVCLLAHVDKEGDTLNLPPRTSIIVETVMLQALSILLQNSNQLTLEQYYRWHPGGKLGEKAKKQIQIEN